jgi:hypothetical protein
MAKKTNFQIKIKKHRKKIKDIVSAYKDNVAFVKGPKVTIRTKKR